MKKALNILFFLFAGLAIAQEEQPKDSVKTEVVNVVTSYAPKITDAFKIKRKPTIELSKQVDKKELEYEIIEVPVASTFIPQSGTLKPIKLGERERLFDNYVSLGFGNNFNPYFEGYMHKNLNFDSEFRASLRLNLSQDPVKTDLSSSFYNADVDLFYKQIGRYFDWKAGFIAERDQYNWYGLPSNIEFTDAVISQIEPKQIYKDFKIYGGLEFEESYIKEGNLAVNYFSDDFENDEINAKFDVAFSFPLGRFGVNSEDLQLGFSTEYLTGGFGPYTDAFNFVTETEYGFLNVGLHPYYRFNWYNFDVRIGAKGYFALDTKNSTNEFYVYPDVEISYPIIKQFANLYVGAIGDLQNNSYKSLSNLNPYVSPTLFITQTDKVYDAYAGLKGIIDRTLNYNFKARYSDEQNKPFFLLNESKSDGTNFAPINSFSFSGFEYGNSFGVLYDNVQTLSFIGEAEYDYSRHLSLGLNVEYNLYTTENLEEAWGLPEITGDVYGVYKTEKWYAGANIYYVGDRKGIVYDDTLENGYTSTDVNGYIDVNFNGGYHFNPLLSFFVKVNNISNGQYQRFQNFDAQGIQVLGGFIWKFDSFF